MDPIVLASARRNGVADQDILHAYRNPVRVFEFDDLTMLIGADAAGRVLEIGMATPEGTELIAWGGDYRTPAISGRALVAG